MRCIGLYLPIALHVRLVSSQGYRFPLAISGAGNEKQVAGMLNRLPEQMTVSVAMHRSYVQVSVILLCQDFICPPLGKLLSLLGKFNIP